MRSWTARSIYRGLAAAAALTATSAIWCGIEFRALAAVELETSATAVRASLRVNDWPAVQRSVSELPSSTWRQLIDARLAASRLDETAAHRILEPMIESGTLSADQRIFALSTLAGVQFARANYVAAARSARAWRTELSEAGHSDELADVEQFLFVAETLSRAPAQELVALAPEEEVTTPDKVGLVRAAVDINDREVDAVLDTGANISVLSRSLAERLNLLMLQGEGSIASSTMDAVDAQIGIADRITIAGAELKNVAFLVLDDSSLTFPVPGGYTIDAIIGFPVFKALERVRFSREGTFSWAPPAEGRHEQNLFADGNDLYLTAGIDGASIALHLDTGATVSNLSNSSVSRIPGFVEASESSKVRARRQASAGGAVSRQARALSRVRMRIDDASICLPSIDLAAAEAPAGDNKLGTIGQDVLGQLGGYSIDFVFMRFEAEAAGEDDPSCNAPGR